MVLMVFFLFDLPVNLMNENLALQVFHPNDIYSENLRRWARLDFTCYLLRLALEWWPFSDARGLVGASSRI